MLTEADTCRKYVVPKLQGAGWDNGPHSVTERRSAGFVLLNTALSLQHSALFSSAVNQLQSLLYPDWPSPLLLGGRTEVPASRDRRRENAEIMKAESLKSAILDRTFKGEL